MRRPRLLLALAVTATTLAGGPPVASRSDTADAADGPLTGAPPAGNAWTPDTAYAIGQVVTHNGARYQVRQSHTSPPGWEPPSVLALFLPL